MSTAADPLAPPEPAAPPDQPREDAALVTPGQMEGMFGGLDKMADALPPERKQQMSDLLEGSVDPDGDKAGFANVAFLAHAYGKDPQEIAQNSEAYREDYAKQMFHVEQPVDDKAFYGLVGQHFQKQRDERALLTEVQGKLFEHFKAGEDNWKQPFTKALAEMQGKPGFDPKRLDIYRELASQQWKAWNDAGDHYPAAIDDLTAYFKLVRSGLAPGDDVKAVEARKRALIALQTIPEGDQDAVLGLATRGAPDKGIMDKGEPRGMAEKIANRMETGVGELAANAFTAAKDLATGDMPGGYGPALMVGNQMMRRPERKLDQFISGQVDPNTADGWLAKGVLSTAEGLPALIAAFTPPGILMNLGAMSEEARGHFEDAGVSPEKAAVLGPLAGVAMTTLQTTKASVVLGKLGDKLGGKAVTKWMADNLAGKVGSELAKGYVKNIMAAGAIDTVKLGVITAGQQLSEPALQAIAHQLDQSIPGIQWSGKDGEWRMLARATPETLAGLVPLIVLGTGMGVLRSREAARNTVFNAPALRAVGLPEEAVQQVMEQHEPEAAVHVLQQVFEKREPNPAAVEKLNETYLQRQPGFAKWFEGSQVVDENGKPKMMMHGAQRADRIAGKILKSRSTSGPMPFFTDNADIASSYATGKADNSLEAKRGKASLAPDGSYVVKDAGGVPVDRTSTAEMAAKALEEQSKVVPMELSKEDRARMREEEQGNMDQENGRGYTLRDLFLGKKDALHAAGLTSPLRVQSPSAAKAAGSWAGEAKSMREGLPFSWFHNAGLNLEDGLQAKLNELGFEASTPQEAMDLVMQAGRGEDVIPRGAMDLSSEENLGTKRPQMHYGITNPVMARAMDFVRTIGTEAKKVVSELRGLPEFGKFRETLNEMNAEAQRRGMNLAGEVRQVFDAVPDKLTRRAMYRAIEAGFDKKQLQEWKDGSTRNSSKQAYEAALKLTPAQVEYAKKLKAWFEAKHPQAVEAGLLDPEQKRKDYVPLMVDKPYDVKGNPATWGGKLKGDFSHAITREFKNSFDLETAQDEEGHNLGLKLLSDDMPEVMALYGAELDKVDLTRQALKALSSAKAKAEDGEPLVQPVHGVLTNKPETGSTITNPSATVSESGVKYETLDHPAFKRFYFAGQDLEGKPVMFKGEMGLHPDIYPHLANILGRSKIQNWADSPGGAVAHLAKVAFKAVQEAQRFIKANMFTASAFHATHIGTRAAGNLVAPWELKRVSPDDPHAMDAMRHGLQLGGDHAAMREVEEGLGGGKGYNVLAKVPGIEKVVNGITKATFHDIIPAYKLETWNQLNAKNQKIFAKDIAAGRATEAQVKYLTSQQVNARFGEQNYTDLGANPTFRHVLSLLTLAPDFWRSNMQNLKQVGVGLTGSKVGREPAKAFVITAGVTWLASRLLNKALSDDDSYHFETPFEVHHGGRTYSFRTEVQDVAKMVTKPNEYLMGRLSPFASSALEYLVGVNWRGEKVNATDVLKETATKAIPASLKWLPGPGQAAEWGEGHRATTSHFEEFLTSQGIKVGRDTPLTAAYQLAGDYKKNVLKSDEKQVSYPVSKFQQLRYALEDGDDKKAKAELAKLITEKEPFAKVSKGLRSSLFHPWTGSRKTDYDFKASLSKEDLAKVERAEAHRRDIWESFQRIHADHASDDEEKTDE